MAPAFQKSEYEDRLTRVRKAMLLKGLEVLIIGDPANINWLCGYDAWSFYTPQMMLVDLDNGPIWLGREMDAGAAKFTTYLESESVIGYSEDLVQRQNIHPSEFLASWMHESGYGSSKIGYESDVYYLSPKSLDTLKKGLPKAQWIDADLLVNWVRVIKSEAELELMRVASQIADHAMKTAWERVRVGITQSELMSEIVAAQIKGVNGFGGDMTALHPLILAGEAASTAHPMWTDTKLEEGQTIAFELGGCRKRYNVGLARTIHLGKKKPNALTDTAKAVEEGMQAVIDTMASGVKAGDVHKAWQKVLDYYRLEKKSRIGYSIGVGYPPDWGEHTISFRAEEQTVIPENAVVHIILGMWMDGWGMELSETLHVRKNDCIRLSKFPQHVELIS